MLHPDQHLRNPYAKSYGVDMNDYGNRLAFIFTVSLCLAWPLGWLCDRYHPLRVVVVSLFAYLGVMLYGVFGVHNASSYLNAYVLHGIISGCYYTSVASLGQRLFPREKFAQFASAALLFASPLHMSLAPLVGLLIDHTGNIYRHAFTVGGTRSPGDTLVLVCLHALPKTRWPGPLHRAVIRMPCRLYFRGRRHLKIC